MAIKDTLSKIIEYGEQWDYISYKAIKDLDKSCCNESNLTIIDFDAFKDKFIKEKGFQHFQSCDALKIVETHFDFIEMKGFGALFFNEKVPDIHKSQEKISNDIDNFGISTKLKDSLLIWDIFIKEKDLLKGHEVREIEQNVTFRFILLTDVEIDSIEWLAINFNFFAEFNSNLDSFLHQKLQEQLDGIDQSIIARIKNLPLLKTCTEIDDYYATV
jgi:hypothetical protein